MALLTVRSCAVTGRGRRTFSGGRLERRRRRRRGKRRARRAQSDCATAAAPITPPAKKQKAKKSRRHVAAEKEKEKTKSTGKGKGQEAKALPPPGDDKWLGATVEKEFSDGRYRGTVHGITAASASEDNPLYYLIHYDEDDDAEEFDHDELLFHLMPQNQVVCLFHTEPSLPLFHPNLRRSP